MRRRWKDFVEPGRAFHLSLALDHRRMPIAYHGHDFAEVMWVEEGEGIHHVNGQRQTLSAGDLIFIRPQDHHSLMASDGRVFRLQNLAFPRPVPARLAKLYFNKDDDWFTSGRPMPKCVSLDARQQGELRAELTRLQQAPREVLPLDTFLLNLFRLLGRAQHAPAHLPDWLSSAMQRFTADKNMQSGVQYFHRLAGRSPEHVARIMQKHTGLTPTAWVNMQRLDHAARLLESTMIPVTEIAFEAGFENLGYFFRIFRTRYGTSPRLYRMRQTAVM